MKFGSVRDTTKRMKRKTIDWEKIVAGHISDKGCALKFTKNLKFNNEKTNISIKSGKRSKVTPHQRPMDGK
jgi:hypothetical protein